MVDFDEPDINDVCPAMSIWLLDRTRSFLELPSTAYIVVAYNPALELANYHEWL